MAAPSWQRCGPPFISLCSVTLYLPQWSNELLPGLTFEQKQAVAGALANLSTVLVPAHD